MSDDFDDHEDYFRRKTDRAAETTFLLFEIAAFALMTWLLWVGLEWMSSHL
jgi:hypothetical protein